MRRAVKVIAHAQTQTRPSPCPKATAQPGLTDDPSPRGSAWGSARHPQRHPEPHPPHQPCRTRETHQADGLTGIGSRLRGIDPPSPRPFRGQVDNSVAHNVAFRLIGRKRRFCGVPAQAGTMLDIGPAPRFHLFQEFKGDPGAGRGGEAGSGLRKFARGLNSLDHRVPGLSLRGESERPSSRGGAERKERSRCCCRSSVRRC